MSKKSKESLSSSKKIKNLCYCSLFAAIVCVCTLISVPLPFGYFNLGDAAVLLGGWILGPLLGCIAAAIGSALADVLVGYAIYAPATALIKALMVLCSFAIYAPLCARAKGSAFNVFAHTLSAVAAEVVMIFGYLFYESVVLSYGAGALASITGNVVQGVFGVAISSALYAILKKRVSIDNINSSIK